MSNRNTDITLTAALNRDEPSDVSMIFSQWLLATRPRSRGGALENLIVLFTAWAAYEIMRRRN